MTNLGKSCLNIIPMTANGKSCNTDWLQEPIAAYVWALGTSIAAVGNIPTPAEVQVAINAGLVTKIAFGSVTMADGTPQIFEATANQDGVPLQIDESKSMEGYITNLSNKINKWLSSLGYNRQVVQFGWVGKEGRWHGEKTGVKASIQILKPALSGVRTLQRKLVISWNPLQSVEYDWSDVNTDYLFLENITTIGTFTTTDEGIGTSADAFNGYENLGGIDFAIYPILYAHVVSLTEVRWYASAAARTTATTYLFKFNPTSAILTSGNVVGVTVSGSLTIENIDIIATDDFTVTFN